MMRTIVFLLFMLFNVFNIYSLDYTAKEMKSFLDIVWVIVGASLVFMMQAGFLTLEAGLSRAKNSINVAIKNVTDFLVAAIGFFIVGYAIMFGNNNFLLINTKSAYEFVFFIFQVMFVGTSATIVSGAVAERMKFAPYILISIFISTVIYPVFGQWAWGGLLYKEHSGWLQNLGFLDFAGSTVVHSIGGWVSLAAVIVIGPRTGKFLNNGEIRKFHGHNLPMVFLGVFILFFGWFGFNGGSTLEVNDSIPVIILNTIISACFGGVTALILSWLFSKSKLPEPEMIANGIIGGLVGITAGCAFVTPVSSAFIGIISGIVVFYSTYLIENIFRLDDVVGAIAAHGFCGASGTILTGIFIKEEFLITSGHSRLYQIGIQFLGVILAFLWAFFLALLFFTILKVFMPLRVSKEDEEIGLNTAEHGASTSLFELAKSIKNIINLRNYTKIPKIKEIEHGTEAGELAILFNKLIDVLSNDFANKEKLLNKKNMEIEKAHNDEKNLRIDLENKLNEVINVIKDLINSFESLSNFITENKNKINKLLNITHKSQVVMQKTLNSINDIGESAKIISKMAVVINDISDETNLLALNAAIEAARSGEYGRGFSVVANEIRLLADKAKDNSENISKNVTNIVNLIKATVDITENTYQTINEINYEIENITLFINKIIERNNTMKNESLMVSSMLSKIEDSLLMEPVLN